MEILKTTPRTRRSPRLLALLLPLLGLAAVPAPATESTPDEVKAAFVVNFVKFTRWPAVPPPPFRLCFLTAGEPVGSVTAQNAPPPADLPLEVRRGLEPGDLDRCDLVYFGERDRHRISEVLLLLHRFPALTVSDLPNFLEAGGMIQLLPEGRKYRFAVNLKAVRDSRLELDGRLLSLARTLEGQHGLGN